jgi:hypothetical protein
MTLECWRKYRRESQNLKPQRARRTTAEDAENDRRGRGERPRRTRRTAGGRGERPQRAQRLRNSFKCKPLIGEHEGDGDLGSDGDFVAVDGEGLVAPLANRVDGGVGKLGISADRGYLLHSSVGANEGLKGH